MRKEFSKPMVKSIWIFEWINSCGFSEVLPLDSSKFDMERFGIKAVSSPRHADCLLIGGYQTLKSIEIAKRIYEQMPEPKCVIALGSCPISGGMYWDSYNTVKKVDKYIPVDLWILGCPPRPEAIIDGIISLVNAINGGKND